MSAAENEFLINPPPQAGVFIAAGNAFSSCLLLMTLDTQMTLALLQELLMALRAYEADRITLGLRSALNSLEGT